MRIIPERLDYLWFLGYGLDDAVADHSVLSKARARWGKALFAKLLVRTVWQCVRAGLLDGDKIHVDSSLIAANASASKNLINGSAEFDGGFARGLLSARQKALSASAAGQLSAEV